MFAAGGKHSARGHNGAILFPGETDTGTWPFKLGSLKIETKKYGHDTRRTKTQQRLQCQDPASTVNYRPISCQRGHILIKKHECLKIISMAEKDKVVMGTRWWLDT
jgi:hypothetical protein